MRNLSTPSIILIILINFIVCITSKAETDNLNNVNRSKLFFKYLQDKNWQDADNLIKKINNTTLKKILLSQKFLDKEYKNITFKQVTQFLNQNPKWPQRGPLKSRAESLIDDNYNKKEVYQWFSKNSPITSNGHKYYALAASQIVTDTKQLTPIIKNGWIYGCFNEKEQLAFHKKFKRFLNKNDTIKRIDNLISKGSITLAKSLFHLVDAKYKRSFEAQIAFYKKDKNAQKLFRGIQKEYRTPGAVYQYINSIKKDLPDSKKVIGLLQSIKDYRLYENDFLKVQTYIAREYIEHKKYNDAYRMASNHFARSADNIRDIEFLSGWLSLRFLNKPDLAIKHFKKFNQVVKPPISVSRGLYWLGRAYAQNGNNEEAIKLYKKAANKFGYTFYGQAATVEMGVSKLKLPEKISVDPAKNAKVIKNNELLLATNLITKHAPQSPLARIYLENLIDKTQKSDIATVALAVQTTYPHHKVWMSRRALQKHVLIENYSYPDPYKTTKMPTEKSLVYSIIRQESSFEKSVVAYDNGLGLMQLMKPTACDTAKKLNMKCQIKRLTQDANYNITIGSHYLADMIEAHEGSYILAIAAYNAGPHRTERWLGLHGDLRKFKHHHKVIDWIESIPFPATRNYVQRVLENLQIYRTILNKNNKFILKHDLLRKK